MIDASTAPYAAVVLRLALGILFLAHGLRAVAIAASTRQGSGLSVGLLAGQERRRCRAAPGRGSPNRLPGGTSFRKVRS